MNPFKRHFGSFVFGCIGPLLGVLVADLKLRFMPIPVRDTKSELLIDLVMIVLCVLIGIACVKAGSAIDALREHKKN
jgi:hypothetical protein